MGTQPLLMQPVRSLGCSDVARTSLFWTAIRTFCTLVPLWPLGSLHAFPQQSLCKSEAAFSGGPLCPLDRLWSCLLLFIRSIVSHCPPGQVSISRKRWCLELNPVVVLLWEMGQRAEWGMDPLLLSRALGQSPQGPWRSPRPPGAERAEGDCLLGRLPTACSPEYVGPTVLGQPCEVTKIQAPTGVPPGPSWTHILRATHVGLKLSKFP